MSVASIDASAARPYHAGNLPDERARADMSDITSPVTDDDELEDLEPEPGDAENIKGGSSDSDPSDQGGKGGGGS
jgi:hypothetical protein